MKIFKKILTIISIVLFPLFMLYCIGKNLWNRTFIEFLGGLFLILTGFILAIVLLRPDLTAPIIAFFNSLKGA